MLAAAQFELNRPYFEANFRDWLVSRSRFRRWQRHFAVVLALLAVGLALLEGGARLFAFVAGAGAVIESIEFYWYRSRWVSQRLAARPSGGVVKVQFASDGLEVSGPTSQGRMSWEAVRGASEAGEGFFLQLGDGMSMYIPRSSVTPPEAVPQVLALARRNA